MYTKSHVQSILDTQKNRLEFLLSIQEDFKKEIKETKEFEQKIRINNLQSVLNKQINDQREYIELTEYKLSKF